ncbi:MAG: hypothetical protein JWP57_272 [Spirosoma sp.]|nr:hypothetical protein [Spirosoma sp.]
MVVRVLPSSRGDVYSNTGSAGQLVKYLEHEAREEKREDRAIFFNLSQDRIRGEVVQQHLDTNVKGLRAKEARFHSIVIAPSQDELTHIKDDPEKLKQYTRKVMENYASNFHSRTGKTLTGDDLVWYATVHTSRRHRNQDEEVQSGLARNRQEKGGAQTHIHVVVSARDKRMHRTLHPDSGPKQFNYRAWLQNNNRDFTQQFGYHKLLTEEEQRQRLDKQLSRIDRAGLMLDRDVLASVGQQQKYGSRFWQTLNRLEREVRTGNVFTLNQAYERLQAGDNPNRLEKQLGRLDQLGLPLDQKLMNSIAKQQRYSSGFWKALTTLEDETRQGIVQTPGLAYERLRQAELQQRLDRQLNRLDRAGLLLDRNSINSIAQEQRYSAKFWRTLSGLESEARQGWQPTYNQIYARFTPKQERTSGGAKRDHVNDSRPPASDNRVSLNRGGSRPRPTPENYEISNGTTAGSPVPESGNRAPVANGLPQNEEGRGGAYRLPTLSTRPLQPVNLKPLLAALSFDSLPQEGGQAKNRDDFKRKRRRRR